jgi:hypothetical protein
MTLAFNRMMVVGFFLLIVGDVLLTVAVFK